MFREEETFSFSNLLGRILGINPTEPSPTTINEIVQNSSETTISNSNTLVGSPYSFDLSPLRDPSLFDQYRDSSVPPERPSTILLERLADQHNISNILESIRYADPTIQGEGLFTLFTNIINHLG